MAATLLGCVATFFAIGFLALAAGNLPKGWSANISTGVYAACLAASLAAFATALAWLLNASPEAARQAA